MRPNRSITCWMTAVTEASSETSRSRSVTPLGGPGMRATLRPVPITSNPASASALAAALPIPEVAPVTSATGVVVIVFSSSVLLSRALAVRQLADAVLEQQRDPLTAERLLQLCTEVGPTDDNGVRPQIQQLPRDLGPAHHTEGAVAGQLGQRDDRAAHC